MGRSWKKRKPSRPTWSQLLRQLELNLDATREELLELLEELGIKLDSRLLDD